MSKDWAREKCSTWLWEHDCEIGELDGKDFVIVSCYSLTEKTKSFEKIVETAIGDKWNWGFADEYTMCSECGSAVIQTSPDSYSWQPDYWLGDGFIACKECAKRSADDYIDDMVNHDGRGVKSINTDIAHPEDHGFKLIVESCEYGMHEGQADDPRKVAKWAKDNDIQVVFVTSHGQFDTEWDAYMRPGDYEETEFTEEEVEEIRGALVNRGGSVYYQCDRLKDEFRQYPSPASVLKAQLKQVDDMGVHFAKLDCTGEDGVKVYGSFEEYVRGG